MTAQTQETWAPVLGVPAYEVSDLGRVRSLPRTILRRNGVKVKRSARLLTPWLSKNNGYLYVSLPSGNRTVHSLVLEAFERPRAPGFACRHLDGTRTNNERLNLTWGTYAENSADQKRHGTRASGERSGNSKLTAAQVAAIRDGLAAGLSGGEMSRRFGVHVMTVSDIKRGVTWVGGRS